MLLDAVNDLHPNFQITLETRDDKNSLPFVHLLFNVEPEGTVFLHIVSKTVRYQNNFELS